MRILIVLVLSHSVLSYSLRPLGLDPVRLLCQWDSPGTNTGVGCHFPPPGDLPDPGIEPSTSHVSPALHAGSLPAHIYVCSIIRNVFCFLLPVLGTEFQETLEFLIRVSVVIHRDPISSISECMLIHKVAYNEP